MQVVEVIFELFELGSQLFIDMPEIVEVLFSGLLVLVVAAVDILHQFELQTGEVGGNGFGGQFLFDARDFDHDT